ncbi:hypothetical protein QU38_00625 [Staphylococcus aureus]|uniref:Uncharacterized protein n=1 Tax=Staphylococcus aureus TaxID=1280 RepID=A0AA40JQP0_STAAU|nr:hypothetical protein QU38_00625 [Staphylococcus aureus]
MQIVQHEADVVVDVPVQRGGVDGLPPTGDADRLADLVVEVHRADAAGDFPGADAAAGERERIVRLDTAIGGG